VRVTPRAKRSEITGRRDDGVLLARVAAPPVDGKANAALCALIASALGVPKSRVSVVRGAGSRDKVVRVEGAGADALRALTGRGG
jgi:uncharacterized protein YggU (UPF0235/DUF167 family)